MKKLITLAMLLAVAFLSASIPFNSKDFYDGTIVVCFKMAAMSDRDGHINQQMVDGVVQTGLPGFDQLCREYKVVELSPFFTDVMDKEFSYNERHLQNFFRVRLASSDRMDEAVAAFAKDPSLLLAEFETINRVRFTPDDEYFSQLWHIPVIKANLAWDWERGSRDVVVGIVDTGVKWNHPDLMGNIWVNEGELAHGEVINWASGTIVGNGVDDDHNGKIDDCVGWNFYGTQSNASYQNRPANEHGTHVAGCVAAVGNNATGVTGVAMNVRLLTTRGSSTTEDQTTVANGYDAMKYCAENGADIINCSWGGPGGEGTANTAVAYCTARGSLVVCAAGNDNTEHNASYSDYPSDCDDVICVAASNPNDTKADFSDYGAPIDIMAPGVNILSTVVASNGYQALSGTSMASPITAGAAALVKSHYPDYTWQQVRDRLLNSTDYIYDLNSSYIGKLGSGRLNAYAAVMQPQIPELTIGAIVPMEWDGDADGQINPGDQVMLSVELVNSLNWRMAENVHGTLSCTSPYVNITDGDGSWADIDGGDSAFNDDDYFLFSTTSNLDDLNIPFVLTITCDAGEPYSIQIPFNVELTLSLPNWPVAIGGTSGSTPVFVDINNDGTRELVFGDNQGNVHAMEASAQELDGFPVNVGNSIIGSVAVADLTGDSNMEIVVGTTDNHIVALNHDGSVRFNYSTASQIKGSIVIADLDRDNIKEIVTVAFNGIIYVLEPDGSNKANFPVSTSSVVNASPAILDITGDRNAEILVTSISGQLKAYSVMTGESVSGYPVALGGSCWQGASVGDMDGDGTPEIAAANTRGLITVVHTDGSVMFTYNTGNPIYNGLVICDINNDGNNEIVTADDAGYLHAVKANSTEISGFPVNVGGRCQGAPAVADMDHDGYQDMVFGDGDGYLHIINYQGQELPNYPLNLHTGLNYAAAIGWFDSDWLPDVAILGESGMQVLEHKHSTSLGNAYSLCYRSNPARSDRVSIVTGAAEQTSDAPLVTALNSNYPNPFNPSTTVSFTLAQNGPVKMNIYNVRGQKVTTLVDETMAAGQHNVVWNGCNAQGKTVAGGVYMMRLETRQGTFTRKMVMIK